MPFDSLDSADHQVEDLSTLELERVALRGVVEDAKRRLDQVEREYAAARLMQLSRFGTPTLSSTYIEAVYQTLLEMGEPMHYKEIYEYLQTEELLEIGGSAPLSNLLTQLNRDSRFVRESPGVYGLNEWMSDGSGPLDARSPIERRRSILRLRSLLNTLNLDIQVTQHNLKVLRDALKGARVEGALPEGLDAVGAHRAMDTRLQHLLSRRDAMRAQLSDFSQDGYSKEVTHDGGNSQLIP